MPIWGGISRTLSKAAELTSTKRYRVTASDGERCKRVTFTVRAKDESEALKRAKEKYDTDRYRDFKVKNPMKKTAKKKNCSVNPKAKRTTKKAKKNPAKVTIRRNGETKTLYGAAALKVLEQRKAKSKTAAKRKNAAAKSKPKPASQKKAVKKNAAKKSLKKTARRNASDYSSATPIAVTKHFRSGGPGYATARERIIKAGQRDLFAPQASQEELLGFLRRNPTVTDYVKKRLGAERFKTASPSLLKQTMRQVIKEARSKQTPKTKNPRYLVTGDGRELGILVAPNALQAAQRAKELYGSRGYQKFKATKVAQQDFIGGRTDLAAKARAQRAKKKSNPRKARGRRNPEAGALYETFTGMPSTGYDVVTAPNGTPANVDQLGQFLRFKWQDWDGHKYTVELEKNNVPALLAVSRNKDGYDTLYALGDWALELPAGDHGYITRIEYRAQKVHLGDTSPRVYYHDLGEETGEPPVLRVDKEGKLIFRDGAYWIEDRGIVN
jgi:hypothetical protein